MSNDKIVVAASALRKVYGTKESELEVLKDVDLEVQMGNLVVIGGPSGSGKTTLLNIIGGIDRPTNGQILVLERI